MGKYELEKFESVVDYTTFLDGFEGPLDFLLFLIKENQIEIKDIFVSKVTEQFLMYMQGLEKMDISRASEYLAIAATIIEIKAKSLIPSDDEEEMADEEEMPAYELIRALEEYKLFKEESQKLKDRETIGFMFKEPDKTVGEVKIHYKDFNLNGLLEAFASLMLRQQEISKAKEKFKEIPKDEFTVADKIEFIKLTLQSAPEVFFDELFTNDSTKSEIITTFQAILELLKMQWICVEQTTTFGQIKIKLNTDRSEDNNIEQFDEYH